ncbi:SAM-dependent methyltransferase [cyanobacterium TDX16]|nr:SAM-dependent methyltransferase [cyanobacterium TDX16]
MELTVGWWQISIQRLWPDRERLTQMYNTAAPHWQRQLHLLGYDRAYVKLFQILQQSGVLEHLKDDSLVCDCGIGTAAFCLALTKTVPFKLNVIGVDISSQMLEQADRLLSQAGVSHKVSQSDVNTLPFHDNTFDLVIAAHLLEHLPNPTGGLQEMVRVLRPEAPLILAVTRPGLLGFSIQWHWGNGCLARKNLVEMLTATGLSDIRFYPFTCGLSRWTSIACVGFKK